MRDAPLIVQLYVRTSQLHTGTCPRPCMHALIDTWPTTFTTSVGIDSEFACCERDVYASCVLYSRDELQPERTYLGTTEPPRLVSG